MSEAGSSVLAPDPAPERRRQISRAAMACFARRGFHHTTMQDIGAEAGISVGLIYRYFANKDAVIAFMAKGHLENLARVLEAARRAPGLFEALEILFTARCDEQEERLHAPFVIDLFREAARNGHVRALLREVTQYFIQGVADLLAASDEARRGLLAMSPLSTAELIVDSAHGLMMRSITDASALTAAEIRDRQIAMFRRLWPLLFSRALSPARSEG